MFRHGDSVVLFTLIVQDLTVEPLMRRLGLDCPGVADRRARDEVLSEAARVAAEGIPELPRGGLFSAVFAERLIVQVEPSEVRRLSRSGLVPANLSDDLGETFDGDRRGLVALSISELAVAPEALLRRVPFCVDLAPDEVAEIVPSLRPLTVVAGDCIVRAGERGTSMFFISRGVVCVLADAGAGDALDELATLMAGDFFGEMALRDDTPRSATCRAATACALYELDRCGVEAAVAVGPTLGECLAQAARERRSGAPADAAGHA